MKLLTGLLLAPFIALFLFVIVALFFISVPLVAAFTVVGLTKEEPIF